MSTDNILLQENGQPIKLTFTPFSPGIATVWCSPCLFLTKDGSVHAGDILWHEGRQVLRTTNPAGGLHTVFDISVSQILGFTSAGPRSL